MDEVDYDGPVVVELTEEDVEELSQRFDEKES